MANIGVKDAKIAPAEEEINNKAVFSKDEYKKIPIRAARKKIKKSDFVIRKSIRLDKQESKQISRLDIT
jgi:hypothetical protein